MRESVTKKKQNFSNQLDIEKSKNIPTKAIQLDALMPNRWQPGNDKTENGNCWDSDELSYSYVYLICKKVI